MANKVAIVTDSTAYLPPSEVQQHGIEIAPAVVIWDGEELRDGVDIQPTDFYKRLSASKSMPTTSQPSPAAVKEAYETQLAKGHDVLGIFISEKLSGTIQSARQAKSMLPDANIEIIDTESASMGAGWALLMAARAIAQGADLAEATNIAQQAAEKTGVYLTVDTLEFLHRGGRIGGAQRYIGTALNFKPILQLINGRLEPAERVRTRKKAIRRLADIILEEIDGRTPLYLAALHANCPDDAKKVLELVTDQVEAKETVITDVSPAVGTHTGPGTLGLAYLAGFE